MKHELKIWPQYYDRVANGTKLFQIRDNDRYFQFGDTVVLREWDPEPINKSEIMIPKGYVDDEDRPPLSFKVGYVHVLDSKRVVFSLLPLEKNKAVKS